MPFFSILLATRDRPQLFGEALASVLAQSFEDFEIVVVDDGTAPENLEAYEGVLASAGARLGDRLRLERLVRRANGHGQSYSLNVAAALAGGDYLCILDDDDSWTDPGHLKRAHAAVTAQGEWPDLYMANQRAFLLGEPLPDDLWLARLAAQLQAAARTPGADGSYAVSVDELIAAPGFCHLNVLTVRRALWEQVGGMDEGIRWECDRDLFLRLIDAAEGPMLHHPATVSRHNVPDPSKQANMTTALPMLQKRLHQLRALDKAALFARHPAIRAHGRRERAWALKKIAMELAAAGEWKSAAYYARDGLGASPTPGWLLAAAWYNARALTARRGIS
jgi:glycosyltransferase involved in cell wall biosynthesis